MKAKTFRAQEATTVPVGAGGRRQVPTLLAALAVVLSVASSPAGTAWGASGTTTRVSVDSAGSQANSTSSAAAVSADGRYVAFASHATNLVAHDTNGAPDIFVHDRETGATSRVSVGSGGSQANSSSGTPSISADGRVMAFLSAASNLVAGDTNGAIDVFVYEREGQVTTRVSVGFAGQADASSGQAAISADGRYVAFVSSAPNLVPGDTNGASDVFVHDRVSGATSRVSVASSGAESQRGYHNGNNSSGVRTAISADGRYVAFQSPAPNLVVGDTNGTADVFVHDRQRGATTRVSVDSSGGQAAGHSVLPSISADGKHVAFVSSAANLVAGDTNGKADLFVHDRESGATTRVSVDSSGGQANNVTWHSRMSSDGRYVSFDSWASNLVPGDTNSGPDVFVHDRELATTTRVSVDSSGSGGNAGSLRPDISSDGNLMVFQSQAYNLVAGDTNGQSDIFVHQLSSPPADTIPPAAPTVALTGPVNGANVTAVAVGGMGEAGTTANIAIDDEDPATPAVTSTASVSDSGYSATLDLSNLSDGALTGTVTLTDAAGNTGPAGTASTTKDTAAPLAPSVALTNPVTPRNQSGATVSGEGEAGTTANIWVDDEDVSTAAVTAAVPVSGSGYSATLDLSGLSNGTLTATVTLTDAAGNAGAAGTDAARKVGPPVDRERGSSRP